MLKPSKTPGGYDSAKIARQLVLSALYPKILGKAEKLVEALEGPLNQAVDDFFRELADEMGYSTFDEKIFPAWPDLSPGYVNHKGTGAFWMYSLSPGAQGRWAVSQAGKNRIKTAPDPLIQRFLATSGLRAFGKVKIEIDEKGSGIGPANQVLTSRKDFAKPQVVSGKRSSARVGSGVGQTLQPFVQSFVGSVDYKALDVKINIQLWTKFGKGKGALPPNVEERIVRTGAFSIETLNKLVGNRNDRRQLVRPFMNYYSRFVIPALIKRVIATNFSASTKGFHNVAPITKVNITPRKK
jgi:hypothetical protein